MTTPDRAGALRPLDRSVRVLRSLAAALVCVTAAAVGHRSAGGALPAEAVLAVFAGSATVAWLLSARRVTATQLLGLLALCQICVHLGASPDDMVMGTGMLVAHVAATAASLAALSGGEALVWHLAERLGLRLAPRLHAAVVIPSLRPLLAVVAPRSLRDVRLAHSRSLRGPPVGLV
ncbi:MAG: hypothetical protein ABWX74_16330 [Aeromicrobium sp.]